MLSGSVDWLCLLMSLNIGRVSGYIVGHHRYQSELEAYHFPTNEAMQRHAKHEQINKVPTEGSRGH